MHFFEYIPFCVFEDQHPTFWDCHSSHLHVQFQVSEVRDFEPISSLQSNYSFHAKHSTAYRLKLLFIDGLRNQCECVYQALNLYACHLCSHSWCSTNYSLKGWATANHLHRWAHCGGYWWLALALVSPEQNGHRCLSGNRMKTLALKPT